MCGISPEKAQVRVTYLLIRRSRSRSTTALIGVRFAYLMGRLIGIQVKGINDPSSLHQVLSCIILLI